MYLKIFFIYNQMEELDNESMDTDVLEYNDDLNNNDLNNNDLNNNEINNDIYDIYDINVLNNMKENIQNMSKFNQIEILRILSSHKDVTINENKYGIHINLTDISNEVLNELQLYIQYVSAQELELSQAEKQKEDYKNIYFVKDNKDKLINKNNYVR